MIYRLYGAAPLMSGTLAIDGVAVRASRFDPAPRDCAGVRSHSRRPTSSGAVATLSLAENINQPVLGEVTRPWALSDGALAAQRRRSWLDRFDVRPRDPEIVGLAERRQSAEGAAREMVSDASAAHSARRADARGGRRRAGAGVCRDRGGDEARRGGVCARVRIYEQLTRDLRPRHRLRPRTRRSSNLSGSRSPSRRSPKRATDQSTRRRGDGERRWRERPGRRAAAIRSIVDWFERLALVIVWAVTIAVFGYLRPDSFLTWSNFATILGSQAGHRRHRARPHHSVDCGRLRPLDRQQSDFRRHACSPCSMSIMACRSASAIAGGARRRRAHRRWSTAFSSSISA